MGGKKDNEDKYLQRISFILTTRSQEQKGKPGNVRIIYQSMERKNTVNLEVYS